MHGQLIQWKRNSPTASNMEGSRRSILVELLKQVTNGTSLNVESLQTVFAEAKTVINTKPIISENLIRCSKSSSIVSNAITDNEIKGCYDTSRRVPERGHIVGNSGEVRNT